MIGTKSLTIHYTKAMVYVAYSDDEVVQALRELPARAASELLIPAIAGVLAEAHRAVVDLSYIACCRGPGSFTTIRSMIVTANGLSFASGIPLVGFEACAHTAFPLEQIIQQNQIAYHAGLLEQYLIPSYENQLPLA